MKRADGNRDPAKALREQFASINRDWLTDESGLVLALLVRARTSVTLGHQVHNTARNLVKAMRARQRRAMGLHAFLQHYDLSSQEGIVLMCLAESLLRIPDAATVDKLIADRLTSANWKRHLGASDSLFVNASTWALMLTGSLLQPAEEAVQRPREFIARLANRLEEPVLRAAIRSAMRIMAWQFVMGRTIDEALDRSRDREHSRFRHSFDMLGEAALTAADAARYQASYAGAIRSIGGRVLTAESFFSRPTISVKLSALYPRFEYRHGERAVEALSAALLALAQAARAAGIGLTVDAEEADRLEIQLRVFAAVYADPGLAGWEGLGLAVQAYQKRALGVIRWLEALAAQHRHAIPVRLVKGAYWDTEIKRAQEQGLADYPVFTRKVNTDVSYLACARTLFEDCPHLYPQFATHNAHTLAYVFHHAGARPYEFQRLHGMGAELYAEVVDRDKLNVPCRVYAPVGAHEDLLPYLVRRLLENGANTSFVNQVVHEGISVDEIITDPVWLLETRKDGIRHPAIHLPRDLFAPARINSAGLNLAAPGDRESLLAAMARAETRSWRAEPLVSGKAMKGRVVPVMNPARSGTRIGTAVWADDKAALAALDAADLGWTSWSESAAVDRAALLDRAANLLEERRAELVALCVREAGKTIPDSLAEVREAVDFLRYYAAEARRLFTEPVVLPGPTGEHNELRFAGRGTFLCISPWNFPLAIFTGQIAAALAAGNAVIAKPAEQTSLCGSRVVQLLHAAGVPNEVLQFLPGDGAQLGAVLLQDPRVAGVAFTGSTETAAYINRQLARRDGPIPVLIAETGGQNVLIADSSALPEQLVLDAAHSAFNSAGQRCSALRVLYVQKEIAERVLELLSGWMDQLVIGDPMDLETDVGPVIDAESREALERHIRLTGRSGSLLHRCAPDWSAGRGHFVMPAVLEIKSVGDLPREIFGPVLHVVRYTAGDLDRVIDDINTSGYGLTLGVHSRIAGTAEHIRRRARVGNVYVNRNMIGAVVGSQPFGGRGLSGTGPKAGGPNYLPRFATEQACTINTAAVGGNASLLTLSR
ncbi:MAG: bifunctional proline dehydrogenase/L-glutamate gamma-semialdehyde dehydrogenase PutA [Gammaproteobacteria bacterium]|nr:bifunctional proline dehydrogenase/L-glutamate gamma-semialdehyde dehydrogenase PutA [Gammaproteobacteria bacterium]